MSTFTESEIFHTQHGGGGLEKAKNLNVLLASIWSVHYIVLFLICFLSLYFLFKIDSKSKKIIFPGFLRHLILPFFIPVVCNKLKKKKEKCRDFLLVILTTSIWAFLLGTIFLTLTFSFRLTISGICFGSPLVSYFIASNVSQGEKA